MKLDLLFHDDWEIWGDGSGDCEELMFAPARKILELCDQVGAKYTFFAEVGQQFAMKASSDPAHQKAAKEWEKILKDAVRRGHDVQLHLHPQWIGAKWENNKWRLDFSKFSTARLDPSELKEWLHNGADYLRSLLTNDALGYEVVAFRGGGYMVQPSTGVVSTLKEVGIQADVTVIQGLKMSNSEFGDINFTNAPSRLEPWIPDPSDLAQSNSHFDGLIAIPTYSFQTKLPLPIYSILRYPGSIAFSVDQYRQSRRAHHVPIYFRGKPSAGPRPSLLERVFKNRAIFLDFGLMHHSLIIGHVRDVLRKGRKNGWDSLPMILYTHSKTFQSYGNFKCLLEELSKEKDISFATTRSAVRFYYEKMAQYPS